MSDTIFDEKVKTRTNRESPKEKNNYKKNKHYSQDDEYIIQSWRESTSEPKLNFFQKLFHLKPKKLVPTLIERKIHQIDKHHININALKVCKRLQDRGYQAYIVGGAVRDLLSNRIPKDFDVVTNATPGVIKKIFSNARIIGRRFKLVHIIFRDCIIETATFRANVNSDNISDVMRNNTFGTIEDDCMRRDFSINAMYYCPIKDIIIDYVGGYGDIINKKIRVLKNPNISFTEDPVRMLRAIKYAKLLDCSLDFRTIRAIKKHADLIKTCSIARLHEEINKIYKTNKSSEIFRSLIELKIFPHLMPFFTNIFNKEIINKFCKMLKNLDTYMADKPVSIEVYWAIVLFVAMDIEHTNIDSKNRWEAVKLMCHDMLAPMRVPNKIIDRAFSIFSVYTQLYNDGTLNLLQYIKRTNLAYEVYAFAAAAECKPIRDMLESKVQIPNTAHKQKKKNKPKNKKQKAKTAESQQQQQEQELRETKEEKQNYKVKKCVSTNKKKKNIEEK